MSDVETTETELENGTEAEQDNLQEEIDSIDWKSEALKNKAIADRLKRKLSTQPITKPKEVKLDDEIVSKVNKLEAIEYKRQFGYENGLSPEETDKVFQISGGNPTKEILEDPFVKAGIEAIRAKKRNDNNIPSSSGTSSIFQGKQFSELSKEDAAKAYEETGKKLVQNLR